MRLTAFLLALAGGVLALATVVVLFLIVTGGGLAGQLGLAALIALAIIALAGVEYGSRHTRTAGVALVVLSIIALALSFFSAVFVLRPLLFSYGLSLIGGMLALFLPRRASVT
jgi:hypothetical protein